MPRQDLPRAGGVRDGGTVTLGTFELPPGSAQGPDRWYAVRLHAVLQVARADGDCLLSAATDGATAAQIEIQTHRRWAAISSLGWIQGRRRLVTRAESVPLDFLNYLQVHGVRGGANPFTLTFERIHGRCLRSIRLLRGSGVAATRARPDELRFLVPRTALAATKGHALTVPYKLVRRGGWPDRGPRSRWAFRADGGSTAPARSGSRSCTAAARARSGSRRRRPAPRSCNSAPRGSTTNRARRSR